MTVHSNLENQRAYFHKIKLRLVSLDWRTAVLLEDLKCVELSTLVYSQRRGIHIQAMFKQSKLGAQVWAGYSAGSGNPQRLPPQRESGSRACCSPQTWYSQLRSQCLGSTHLLAVVRRMWSVRNHNSRLFMTKEDSGADLKIRRYRRRAVES